MNSEELRKRTKQFALKAIKLAEALPKTISGKIISVQFIKAATSVASNYRAACRGRSKAEFKSKLHIVLEEADESVFWLEIIIESGMLNNADVASLLKEANELTAIFSKSLFTARQNDS
ncbi:MAG TPA: four helix bundle protein [Lentisphaeria bacterium]|nr:MAG: four helix bundle protein [Lentisphaerae bacterium GWF2_50_93]HCE45623.1 four helix bundle protein [Lentisphaeria bacterium]